MHAFSEIAELIDRKYINQDERYPEYVKRYGSKMNALVEKYKDRDANNIEEKVEESINDLTSTTTTAVQGA